ncbi:copper-translocating P-type ATPase [Desulfococcus multivorans]|nr:CopA: copper-exporting P-type ATPase A [Desulfococcus multivorans]AQV01535.1 copper-translocating P-type ATPase [Desulfococcus multivorans]
MQFFCCEGCRQVFRMLTEARDASDGADPIPFQETELFKECRRMGIIPQAGDDPTAAPANAPETADTASKGSELSEDAADLLGLSFRVEGMWCPACAWLIDETLKKLPGVISPDTRFSTDTFQCRYHPVRTSPDQIRRHIEKLGYRPVDDHEGGASEHRREIYRFAVSAVFSVNVMMLSFALYSGFFTDLSKDAVTYLSWPVFILASVPFFYGGRRIHQKAWAGVRSAVFTMESLISIASGSAFAYSVYNLIQGSIHLYFDTASMLITLTLLGKMLERNARNHVSRDLANLFALKPTKVKRICDLYPKGRYVSVDMLQKTDMFLVEAGDIVPADGVVVSGEGLLDEASLTGEAAPIRKLPGHHIHSGTTVARGVFKVKTEAVGEDSTIGRIIRIIQRSLDEKTAFEGKTDRLLFVFVPLILGLALSTGAFWWMRGVGFETAMVRAITVMVISCPCALGIAIPLARVAGISVAGRNGILVKEFSCFEKAGGVDAVVFDKTGTLTEGRCELREVVSFEPFQRADALALAAGLEQASDHYLAVEIRRKCAEERISAATVSALKGHDNGVSGIWQGRRARIGALNFVPEAGNRDDDRRLQDDGLSRVYLAWGGRLVAVLRFGDRIRPGAKPTVLELQRRGFRVALISGDESRTALAVGRLVGIHESLGGMLPGDKAAFIRQLEAEGMQPAMIGDGINDAPALAAAYLSVAVHSGPYLGKDVADMTLMQSDPRRILTFFDLAVKVNRKILQNLICSGVYNVLSIPVAMAGILTPLVAVTAMLLSSLTVIGNTLLLVRRRT